MAHTLGGAIAEGATQSGSHIAAMATFALTTHGRLYFSLNGVHSWFEGAPGPAAQLLGSVMTKDTSGVIDMLASQRETTFCIVATGHAPPAGRQPKGSCKF